MDTEIDEFGPGVLAKLGAVNESLGGGSTLHVVSDERIWAAEGRRLEAALRENGLGFELLLLAGAPPPYADEALVTFVRKALAAEDFLPLAFGAGTINDVVKRASFELGRRYVCVPTAPSVDGYTSFGAAITVKGFKLSLECPAPFAVVADAELLARAPGELLASGYGDLVAKVPGGVDWMIADAIGVEKLDREIFDMVQPFAMGILDKGSLVSGRDAAAIGELYRGLTASGLAMQRYRDSRPASGAEHLLSHIWEMDHLEHEGRAPSHGFKVAVGTMAMVAMQRLLFSMSAKELGEAASPIDEELLESRLSAAKAAFPPGYGLDLAIEAVRAKTLRTVDLVQRRELILAAWDALRSRALARLPELAALRGNLLDAGCPASPSDIGLTRKEFLRGILVAALIRKRYTILDLASDFGLLDYLAEALASTLEFRTP